jgi:hypothetical protein
MFPHTLIDKAAFLCYNMENTSSGKAVFRLIRYAYYEKE